jgi:N-acetylneuraminic acid mutarotase
MYDTRTDTWQSRRPMHSPRGVLKVVELDGRLYAIGGRDDNQVDQAAVERFDPATDTWQTMDPLLTGRGNPGVAVSARSICRWRAPDGEVLRSCQGPADRPAGATVRRGVVAW